jgi:hypothetical protein
MRASWAWASGSLEGCRATSSTTRRQSPGAAGERRLQHPDAEAAVGEADNIFVERLRRTIKDGEVYPRAYASLSEARVSIGRYLAFYNRRRPHSSLGGRTPDRAYLIRCSRSRPRHKQGGHPLTETSRANSPDLNSIEFAFSKLKANGPHPGGYCLDRGCQHGDGGRAAARAIEIKAH